MEEPTHSPLTSHPGVIVRPAGLRPGSYDHEVATKIPAAKLIAGMTTMRVGELLDILLT